MEAMLPLVLLLLAVFVLGRLAWMAVVPSARQVAPRPTGRRALAPQRSS